VGRPPDIPAEVVYEVIRVLVNRQTDQSVRPTSTEIAKELTKRLGRIDNPVTGAVIRSIIARNPDWDLPPPLQGRPRGSRISSASIEALEPIDDKHRRSSTYFRLIAFDRFLENPNRDELAVNPFLRETVAIMEKRIREKTVYDYDLNLGFYSRPARLDEWGSHVAKRQPGNPVDRSE
jgi:hypothetical protein